MGFTACRGALAGRALRRWCTSLPVLLVALAGLVLLPAASQAATVLRVLAWPGYADPDFVEVFEKRHGVKVEITTVASDDVLRANDGLAIVDFVTHQEDWKAPGCVLAHFLHASVDLMKRTLVGNVVDDNSRRGLLEVGLSHDTVSSPTTAVP